MRIWSATRMRGSVLVYLVCLSVVPMLGLGIFGTVLVVQARDQAAAMRRLEAAMNTVQRLDDLRLAILDESTSSVATALSAQIGLPLQQMMIMSGIDITPLGDAQARTDAVLAGLAGLAGDEGGAATAAEVVRMVTPLRREQAAGSPAEAPDQLVALGSYGQVMAATEEAEISAAQALSGGRYGKGDVALSEAAGELTAVTVLAVHSGRRAGALYAAYYTTDARTLAALRQADAAYRAMIALLERSLTGDLAARWRETSTSSSAQAVDDLIAKELAPGPRATAPSPMSAATLRLGQAVAGVYGEQGPFLALAVDRGVGAARASRADASDHARTVVLASLGLTVVTAALLLLIGGAVRYRLHLLSRAAHQLSSGQLATVDVRGPHELAVAGQGLNDAVRSLGRVLVNAERLARGDLTAAELSEPLEGRLGAAVTTAFEQVRDAIREREQLQLTLAHQATHDVLTGLPNRGAAQDLLEAAVQDPAPGRATAVLFIDLDHFKPLNDTYGHAAGDHVLQVAAARMGAQVRADDTLCRLGGDEFVVVVQGTRMDATAIGRRIVASIAEPIPWRDRAFTIGASVGVAVREDGDTADTLLARADHAVYRAKAEGRGTVRFAGAAAETGAET